MRYQPLPASFHAVNRAKLAEAIGSEAIAIIDTADEQPRNADCNFPFRPDSNFYYLTGIDQPDAVLILVPGAADPAERELLFVRETNEFIATWEGERYSQTEAAAVSGVKQVFWTSELKAKLASLLVHHQSVYTNADEIAPNRPLTSAQRRAASLRRQRPRPELRSALPHLAKQRMIKDPVELVQIRHAIDLTKQGLEVVRDTLAAGQYEYEAEAKLTKIFVAGGATHAYAPIVAAGTSATVLHYVKNDRKISPDELVLFDVGAEYGWYAADVTRVLSSGSFTKRQKEVYEAVLSVQRAAIAMLKPGLKRRDYEQAVVQLVGEQLVMLGVLKPHETEGEAGIKAIRQYYPHSISHFMGLDVHDIGIYSEPLAAGMVLTCEPGIYLKDEGIGVRLEDDILITETGHENLSAGIPIELAELIKT